jgi:hypothetical protein
MQNANVVPVISPGISQVTDISEAEVLENEQIVKFEDVDCTPRASKTMYGFREIGGYNPYIAMADLVDNSIDAFAKDIKFWFRTKNGISQIIIGDNGDGMDSDTLKEAMCMGSNLDKDPKSDLGKFGLGLKLAPFKMGKKLTILSKTREDNWKKIIFDCDSIYEFNTWKAKFSNGISNSDNDIINKLFVDKKNPKDFSGTILIIEKLDKFGGCEWEKDFKDEPAMKNKLNTTQVAGILRKHLSRIFWKKIEKGLNIYIKTGTNEEKIELYDPLEWNDFIEKKIAEPIDYGEKDISVNFKNENSEEKTGIIKCKWICFPLMKKDPNHDKRKQLLQDCWENSGIFVYRNDRVKGVTLDLYEKHNSLVKFRISLSFGSELDFATGVSIEKQIHRDTIQQSVWDALYREIRPIYTRLYKLIGYHKNSENKEKYHGNLESVSDDIRKNSKSLDLPIVKIKKEKRNSPTVHSGTRVGNGTKIRIPNKVQEVRGRLIDHNWYDKQMGISGLIFEVDKNPDNNSIDISLNSEHPIYKHICSNTALSYFITCMAQSEIQYRYDPCQEAEGFKRELEPMEVIDSFKLRLSNNLRVLTNELDKYDIKK